jgi:molecular chaperone IbpA
MAVPEVKHNRNEKLNVENLGRRRATDLPRTGCLLIRHYPPYNIERASENAYRVSVAVAGFTDADLSIETKENGLTIRGEKQTNDGETTGDVLYQGIAARTFERRFQLADYVKVKGASLENGLLHVDLMREIPEAMKSRSIPIANSSKFLEVKPSKVAA